MVCRPSSVRVLAILPEIETPRLALRRFVFDDAPFVVELLNQPSFIRNIGDRGVRNTDDARRYLREGPLAMYEKYGYGLLHASRRSDGLAVGMCGLLKRDILPDTDIGYAFLPAHWGQGYALEAARATLEHGMRKFGLERVIGVVSEHNDASIRVLEKLGMRFERMYPMHADEPEVRLYSLNPGAATSGSPRA
jgi:[ribosomal protein S5]-alanine N-acetyltransferase